MRRKSFGLDVVGPEAHTRSVRKHRYWYEPFAVKPLCFDAEAAIADGAPSVSVLHQNAVFTGYHTLLFTPLATAADSDAVIISPVQGSEGGYNWGGDQVLGDGYEINFGGLLTDHPRVYLTGSQAPEHGFYMRGRVSVEDVSGLSLFFGFRGGATIQAVQAALESYTDVFGISALGDSASAGAPVSISHCLTGDASDVVTAVATSSALADGTVYEFEVGVGPSFDNDVRSSLRPYFKINGVEIREITTNVLTARYFTPILRFNHVSDVGGQVKTFQFEGGLPQDHNGILLSA